MADDHGKKLEEHAELLEAAKREAAAKALARGGNTGIRGSATGGGSTTKDHVERRKKAAEKKAMIEAHEEADALGATKKLRDELDRKEKLRSLSKRRSGSRAGKSNKDQGENSQAATPVKLTNLNQERPSTGVPRGRAPPQQQESPEAPKKRPTTAASGTSKDRDLYALREQRAL